MRYDRTKKREKHYDNLLNDKIIPLIFDQLNESNQVYACYSGFLTIIVLFVKRRKGTFFFFNGPSNIKNLIDSIVNLHKMHIHNDFTEYYRKCSMKSIKVCFKKRV